MRRAYCVLPHGARGRSFRYLTVAMRFAEQTMTSLRRASPNADPRVELYADHPNGKREHATLMIDRETNYSRWVWHREIGSMWK